eukprot:SM000027S09662  [mRNA]  locus=s27:644561:647889:+ [translate_table: standard]
MQQLFVHDNDRILINVSAAAAAAPARLAAPAADGGGAPGRGRRAGPREKIYFDPPTVVAAIVTCGGLCPGMNDVIRQIVYTLETYGVREILGVQYGLRGFVDEKLPPMKLTHGMVNDISMKGGSFLGVSRGHPESSEIADALEKWGVNMLFVIGGNGSHAGANAVYEICRERNMKIVVVGVPKTIDNDILLVDKTFGFDTAVEEAQRAISAAYIEATSAYSGVGVVKLMGRQSGFIAMHAALASGHVDCVLIPEVRPMHASGCLLIHYLHNSIWAVLLNGISAMSCWTGSVTLSWSGAIRDGGGTRAFCSSSSAASRPMATLSSSSPKALASNTYLLVAEELLEGVSGTDASGNPILGDIGRFVVQEVKRYFKEAGMPADVKSIDPTYMIRACPANAADHIFCSVLGQNAVHGAFAGYSNFTVGLVNTHYCLLPIPAVIRHMRTVNPNSNMWHRCVTSTGQPDFWAALPPVTADVGIGEEPSPLGGGSEPVAPVGLGR